MCTIDPSGAARHVGHKDGRLDSWRRAAAAAVVGGRRRRPALVGNISQKDVPHMAVRVGRAVATGAIRLEDVILHGHSVGREVINE